MSNTAKECSLCGFCKVNCPVFRATLNESKSPLGRAVQIKKDKVTEDFYNCSLCGACMAECPANVDLELDKRRAELVRKGIETKANRIMIENVRKYSNPFGKVENGKVPKDLYCC